MPQQFAEEFERVRNQVLTMGGLVEGQLQGAIEAMIAGDTDKARTIERDDYRINAKEVEIDEECTRLLAKRQPEASELRLVMSVIKTISDLERIGDESERVAKMAKFMGGDRLHENVMTEFEHMGQLVRAMLANVLDAFARTSVEQAVAVVEADQKVDAKYESITRQLMTYMAEDPRAIPAVLNILWAARALERIGDRSQNIAEYIIYLVKGKDVRHTTFEAVVAAAQDETPVDPPLPSQSVVDSEG
ncbi:MAG: phosphate signaling complex protein PhoU [Pseudomonadota bacterium]